MEKTNNRQVAFKCTIEQVLNSEYIKEEGWTPNYLKIEDKKVSRLNIIAVLVNKTETGQNQNMTIDDGTGSINMIAFERFFGIDNMKVGELVNIIGRPRIYNEEKYIIPEIIKTIDKRWISVRKKELGIKENKIETNIEQDPLTPFENVIEIIKKIDNGAGVSYQEIESCFKDEKLEEVISSLLERGEIFEITPGKYKVLE